MSPRTIKLRSENNDFQHAEVLKRNRTKRLRFKEFFVEGVRSINAAVSSGWRINAFLYCRERQLSRWAQDILESSRARVHYELTAALMEKLSDKEETSEILAIVEMAADDLARIPIRTDLLVSVFDRPASPGNLGASIRCCDAFGAHGVVITGHSVDLYHPHTVRGSMGCLFYQNVVRLESHNELLAWIGKIKQQLPDLQIVGTSAQAPAEVSRHNFKKPTIIVFGNETHGMSQAYSELCTDLVKINMQGKASSLNISCACSVLLYEASRQRS